MKAPSLEALYSWFRCRSSLFSLNDRVSGLDASGDGRNF